MNAPESNAEARNDADYSVAREIPDSVVKALLRQWGWTTTERNARESGMWKDAEDIAETVIDAWEAWQALPTVSVHFDLDDGAWYWSCDAQSRRCLADNLGMGSGYAASVYAVEDAGAHLANAHDGEGRIQ